MTCIDRFVPARVSGVSRALTLVGLTGALGWLPTLAAAQQALPPALTPGAQQSQERAQREEQQREERLRQGATGSEVRTPGNAPPPAASTVRNIQVQRIDVDASLILSAVELDAVLAPLRGQTVSLADLQAAVEQINALYEARHELTARAFLPPQTIREGVVRIRLVESRTGDVRIGGAQAMAPAYVRERLRLSQDERLSIPALEEDLARFNRLNETQLTAQVVAGPRFGTTDVEITVTEPKRLRLDAFVDNAGRDTTGLLRYGLSARTSNLVGASDVGQLSATQSKGSNSLALSWSVPLNRQDTRVELSGSTGDIRIIDGPFEPLDITGRSQDITLGLTQPLSVKMDGAWSTYLRLSERKSQSLFSGFVQTSEQQHVVTLGLAGDRVNASRSWYADHQLVSGAKSLGGDSDFMYYRLVGNRIDMLDERTQLLTRGGLQLSQDHLMPSGEQFQVGGGYSVRGYSEGLLSGTQGYYFSIELRRGLGALEYLQSEAGSPRLQWLTFLDHGAAFPYRPGNQEDIVRSDFLTSVGVGAVLEWGRYSARIMLAAPLTKNPAELNPVAVRVHAYLNVSLY